MPKTTTHLHCIVHAYDRIEADTGNYINDTVVDVLAEDAKAALIRVEELVPGKNYALATIIEHLDGQPCAKG